MGSVAPRAGRGNQEQPSGVWKQEANRGSNWGHFSSHPQVPLGEGRGPAEITWQGLLATKDGVHSGGSRVPLFHDLPPHPPWRSFQKGVEW